MSTLEDHLVRAAATLDVPGAVVVASDAKGEFRYAKAFGVRTLKEGEEPESLRLDSAFWIASCTKLMTAIAVLQCVERGQFTLDEDISRLLPEFKDVEILKGFEEGTEKPLLVKATNKITLRLLLTHSSGLAYDIFTPELMKWRKSRRETPIFTGRTIKDKFLTPLLFEPGEGHIYSPGPDWAGQMVERVSGMSLGKYMEKHIWEPLGIKDITFRLEERLDIEHRMQDMSARIGGAHPLFGIPLDPTSKVTWTADKVWGPMKEDSGGAGAYGTAIEYQKIIHSITVGDGKLLGSEMLEELFRPQLGESSRAQLMSLMQYKEIAQMLAPGLPSGVNLDHALGGMVILDDIDGRQRKGTLYWAGLPNCYWWADRTTGLSGAYFSQVIPTADPKTIALYAEFQTAMYEKVQALRGN